MTTKHCAQDDAVTMAPFAPLNSPKDRVSKLDSIGAMPMATPYYADECVTLYLGSCLEVTEWLDADVLVTDPPYGIGGNLSTRAEVAIQEWDTTLEVRDSALRMWREDRPEPERPWAMFGSPRRLDAAPPHREVPLVWDKGHVGTGDTTFPWKPTYELIYVGGPGWSGHRDPAILRFPITTRDAKLIGHPTPKPIALMEHLLSKSPRGAVIADPFVGSGSTLIAAKLNGRKAVGVELSEESAEIAAARLAQDVLPIEGVW